MDLFEYAKNQVNETSPREAIYSVGEITTEIKDLLEGNFGKERIWVKGEVSNFKGRNQTGHMYFSLKDEGAVLNCAFFRMANRALSFDMKDGLEVLVAGRISVYPPRGNYQLIVEEIRPGGAGELFLRFELLKKKLEAEGLFETKRKRPLPPFPRRIGLVTSLTGAVVRDVIHVIEQRCPCVTLLVCPCKVQGDGAAEEIVRAISELNEEQHGLEVLIVGRGGGSIEDLWAFNEEIVARAIAASRLPVISAVGHQTDFTIADFVADVRAATPSHAAEMVVPNILDLRRHVGTVVRNLIRELTHAHTQAASHLRGLLRTTVLRDPNLLVGRRRQRVELALERMVFRISSRRERDRERTRRSLREFYSHIAGALPERTLRFEKASSNLALLNPFGILARGYSVVTSKEGKIIKSSSAVKKGDDLSVRLHEGRLACRVSGTFEN